MQLDFSKVRRDDAYSEIELRYTTPKGTRTVRGVGRATSLNTGESVIRVVERDDTTVTVPHERIVEITSTDL